ncbi:MAG: hypothetical protein J7L11_01275 [Thermoprotei archaeon]|nr:hypothetical protein [Thermoprotei archaeon]
MQSIEDLIYRTILEMIASTRGSCMTFSRKKVARRAGLDTKPITLTVVKYVIDTLLEKGMVEYWREGRRARYIVHSTSPLWGIAKELKEKIGENHAQ